MKAEYDLSKLKSRKNPYASKLKKPVTMRLSEDVSKRIILMPSVKDNAKIVAAAKDDPDAKPMTKAQLDALVPIRAVSGSSRSG